MLKHTGLLVLWVGVACLWSASAEPVDVAAELAQIDAFNARGEWRASWASLSKYEIPEWFKDAKFGIYVHPGVYHVILKSTPGKPWRAVNAWRVHMTPVIETVTKEEG